MPVIVIGADTRVGAAITLSLADPGAERRAFVSNPAEAARLRDAGYKVAVGDVSDASHVGGAAVGCFTAVLVTEAAGDGREAAFAGDPEQVVAGWLRAVAEAGVSRVILVGDDAGPPGGVEFAQVDPRDRRPEEVAQEVAALDAAGRI